MADVTTIYLTIPSLQNRISTEVLYKVRNRAAILGLGDNTIVDAETLIKEYISTIAYDIWDKLLSPFGRTLADLEAPLLPFEFDVTYTPVSTALSNCILYRAIWPTKLDYSVEPPVEVVDKVFDRSVIPAITKGIEEVIVSFAVWNWMMDSNIQGWEKYEDQHKVKYDNLRGLTTRRIKLKRMYKY